MTAFPFSDDPPPPAIEEPLFPPAEAPATPAGAKKPRPRWLRWLSRGFAAFAILFILLVGWLAITAPLSKSLEPIAPPQITLLASNGTPVAR